MTFKGPFQLKLFYNSTNATDHHSLCKRASSSGLFSSLTLRAILVPKF